MIQRGRATAVAVCGLVAAVAWAASSAAQIYKWVDEKGTVHFTNDPPAKAPAEVIPETEHRPSVRNEAPPPAEPEAESSAAAPRSVRRRAAPEPADEEIEAVEVIEEESDVIIVDDGLYDPLTRYRANSPRNRPGQPIRQPNRQSVRQPRRGR
jgi:hypothetical protein